MNVAIMNGEGIGYIEDVDTWSVYHVMLEGRTILEISVNNADPELKIWVGQPGSRHAQVTDNLLAQTMCGVPIVTKGRAQKGVHEVGGTDSTPGDLKEHIDGMSVYQYVLPRLLHLVANVYVPKSL